MRYPLRPYQQSVVDAVANFVKYGSGKHGYVKSAGGSGKSVMIAKSAERIHQLGKRVVILARNEKLLRQNRDKFAPEMQDKIGMYCAGLNSYELDKPVTIASIQSIAGKVIPCDIVLVDECQNISPDSESETQYWQFFRDCGNPQIIGFTATDYRTRSGKIQWGECIIDIPIQPLFDKGYIVPPITKAPVDPDLSNIQIKLGEYVQSQLEDVFLEPDLLKVSIEKLLQYGSQRGKGIIFCQSVRHCMAVNAALSDNGVSSVVVTGETPKPVLEQIFQRFQSTNDVKYLVNCNLLTEGFDAPFIDIIAILRSTVSKGLFEQMVYRGTRPFEGKENFLLLDMGGNLSRHGGLGSPYKEPSKNESANKVGRICPACETFTQGSNITECPDCKYVFIKEEPPKVNHDRMPDAGDPVYSNPLRTYKVTDVLYKIHEKKGKPPSLRIVYYCEGADYGSVSEWLAVHSDSDWARNKAYQFFKERGHPLGSDTSTYSMEDIVWHAEHMKKPVEITVNYAEKFPKITEYKFSKDNDAERGSNSEGDSQMVADLLGDDAIPF